MDRDHLDLARRDDDGIHVPGDQILFGSLGSAYRDWSSESDAPLVVLLKLRTKRPKRAIKIGTIP